MLWEQSRIKYIKGIVKRLGEGCTAHDVSRDTFSRYGDSDEDSEKLWETHEVIDIASQVPSVFRYEADSTRIYLV